MLIFCEALMSNALLLIGLGLACGAMLVWGFRRLPGEGWQFIAALPLSKNADGSWRGLNLTWYGLLSANAQTLAAGLLMVLLASLGIDWLITMGSLAALIGLCLPASRWLAQVVEKKSHTFTVGGASFVGFLTAPLLAWAADQTLGHGQGLLPALPFCAALGAAYALGESLGRLACISFGCCYGKPLEDCAPLWQSLFARAHFVFWGSTKKIAYAGGLEGRKVVPVQALTAAIYLGACLGGAFLFLRGAYAASLLASVVTTQLWRALSETLRADYRGEGRLSAYQWMAVAAAVYAVLLAWLLPSPARPLPDLAGGLALLWRPGTLLFLQGLWVAALAYYGLSRVTASALSFHVVQHKL